MKYVFLFVVIIGLGIASFYENSSSTSQAYEDTELSKRESKGVAFYKEQFLESISKTNKADLGALVTDFLDTKVVSRKEKVKIVMGLLDQELDDIDFQYMSSTLSFLNPHEVSDDIVSMIIRTEIPARKAALLNVLGDAFYKEQKPTNLTGKESHLMFSRQQKVRDFLFSTVKSSDNDEVFRAAYSSYMNVFSFEEVLASTDLLFSGNRNPGYSREKLTNDLLRKASTDENLFGKFIPEVLSDKYPKDEEFYDTLSFWIEKSDSKIPSETADLLKKMLKVQIESLPDDVVASSATEMSEIMTKIQAYSKLSDLCTRQKI